MANEREFIAAKDLPFVESGDVNMLVVDPATGEMGQKPADKADLVISLTMPSNVDVTPTSENTSVAIESGSLDNVVEALQANRPPVVKCKHFYIHNGFDTSFPEVEGGVYDCNVRYYNGNIDIYTVIPLSMAVVIVMDINDADYLEVHCFLLSHTGFQVI